MLLGDVLQVLKKNIVQLGYKRSDLYNLLFGSYTNENNSNYDDTIAKVFSNGRSLSNDLTRALCNQKTFLEFCKNINDEYLYHVGNHKGIYEELERLVRNCNYLNNCDKQKLLASVNYNDSQDLARFIGACLVCGNYNVKQHRASKPKIKNEYALNIDYMCLNENAKDLIFEMKLWTASKRKYIESHKTGRRFESLNIIEQLLPRGYISDNSTFRTLAKMDNGEICPLIDICSDLNKDIAIVGVGGIGKTTFFQKLLAEEFTFEDGSEKEYKSGSPIPFFIELNHCPEDIGKWYVDSLNKTNFITRYIAQIYEDHQSLDSVKCETIDLIEKEFQKTPINGKPKYVLLLDGFNEVRTSPGQHIRTYLSNEISVLHNHDKYPNIKIITTSRETQAAYYASEFKNVSLVGLSENDIIEYLSRCHFERAYIGDIMNCKSLVQCLSIPLYLCMFSTQKDDKYFIPETPGEILYSFFHRNSAFYNIRQRAQDTRTNPMNNYQTAFILDFILPYLGWSFDKKDTFYMSDYEFKTSIKDAVKNSKSLFLKSQYNPFSDFDYNKTLIESTIKSLMNDEKDIDTDSIVNCIHGYLGIVYKYKTNEGNYSERIRYSFAHHQFRDYFSAIWETQLLRTLECITSNQFVFCDCENNSFNYFLNSYYWSTYKVEFISQILMEHRNRPELNKYTNNWCSPKEKYDEQKVISKAIDFCRDLVKLHTDIHYLLQNIISVISYGRGEFSGLDLSNLDFKNCSFFNINFSKKGKTQTLAAKFDGSILYPENFSPVNHQDYILDYVYQNDHCFTLDGDGLIKCWDVLSGKLEFELKSEDPLGMYDYSSKGFLKFSKNGKWLATKVQDTYSKKNSVFVNIFDLSKPENPPKRIEFNGTHKLLTFFDFTEDSKNILVIFDKDIVCCFDIESGNLVYEHQFKLYSNTELYAKSAESPIFALTAEYDFYETLYDSTDFWDNEDDYDDDYEDEENSTSAIACQLLSLDISTFKEHTIYEFEGEPNTQPVATYFPYNSCFVLFNYNSSMIEKVNIDTGTSINLFHKVLENGISPSAIHVHPERPNECYVMYPDNCYNVDIDCLDGNNILMKYSISGIEKLMLDSNETGEIEFKTNVVPTNNRFIVGNDTNTYEWDTVNDALLLKYNVAIYSCTALVADSLKNNCMLVHQYNGISIFGDNPLRLKGQICFSEPDYLIGICSYNEKRNIMALTFSKPEHEKIVLLNLDTFEQELIFSTLYKSETVENTCFDDKGENILISSQYQCIEYNLLNKESSIVAKANENERIATGNYTNDEIELAIVKHKESNDNSVKSRCEYYDRYTHNNERTYYKKWYYLLPEITDEMMPYFIIQNDDFGIPCEYKSDNIQTYWATFGFFLEKLSIIEDVLKPICYIRKGNRFVRWKEHEFNPLDMICVKHTSAISQQFRDSNSKYSFMYLSDDMKECLFTEESKKLSYQKNITKLTYDILDNDIKKDIGDSNGNAYWAFAIPWRNGNIVGCYESYILTEIDTKTGQLMEPIDYNPGVSIFGCSFKNIIANDVVKDIIKNNGGIM